MLKGTGRGLVGLLVRPTGGLVDLASGTLSFVSRYICGVVQSSGYMFESSEALEFSWSCDTQLYLYSIGKHKLVTLKSLILGRLAS